MSDRSSVDRIAALPFNPEVWRREFDAVDAESAAGRLRRGRLLVVIARSTVRACTAGEYSVAAGCVPLLPTAESSVLYGAGGSTAPWADEPAMEGAPACAVEVVAGDCVDAAIELVRQGHRPALLNMANEVQPGGGWRTGATAQEEDLFRRSDLHTRLARDAFYPLPEHGCVYTPRARFFRAAREAGYAFAAAPTLLGVVTCAAYATPQTRGARLAPAAEEGTRLKLRAICSAARVHDHDALVLSAFGCGAFANPPTAIAALVSEVALEYSRHFSRIVVAVVDDAAALRNGASNLEAFERAFGPGRRLQPPGPGAAAYDALAARGIVPSMTGRACGGDEEDDARSDLDVCGRTPGQTPDTSDGDSPRTKE